MLLEDYADLSMEIAAMAPSEDWAVSLVAAGVGVAFMPEGCVGQKEGVVTRKLKDVFLTRQVGISVRRDKALPKYVYEILEAFEAY